MRLKKTVAKTLAVFMIATSVPVFAASTNDVDKVVTVKKDATIEAVLAPELKIELKDNLVKGQQFYLRLENAEWDNDVVTALGLNPDFIFKRENKTSLLVEAKRNVPASQTAYKIPLIAKITGGQAKVEIVSNETVVTSGKYAFATSEDTKSILIADEVKVFATEGEMGAVSIEEQYTRAFKSNKAQFVEIEITTKGIEFAYPKGHIVSNALVGSKAYQGEKFNAKIISPTILEVEIPANSFNASQKGTLTFEGIKLKAAKDAVYGEVRVIVSGDLNEAEDATVARYGDYATELTLAKDYSVTAGQELVDIEFTLGEVVADSLNGRRETTFTFSEGIEIKDITVAKAQGLKAGAANPAITIMKEDNKNTSVFKVASITADDKVKTALTFKATLKVPASFKGNLIIEAEGRSLEEIKEVTIAKVDVPVEVDVRPLTAKVGFAQQEGGKLLITETAGGKLSAEEIFLGFDDETIEYTKAPMVKVLAGDIIVDTEAKIIDGGLSISITRKSKEASTIEISGGEFKVNALAADGTYKVKVGGPAISGHSAKVLWDTVKDKHNEIDQVVDQDFMHLGTKTAASNKAQFTIGKKSYTVNGAEKTMDTTAYLSEGRTMLPVRYVADALGIPANQIIWDAKEKAVIMIVHADGALDVIVRIELGNKELVINNVSSQMTAAAEMKDNRVFIPVAEIARALGADVHWDEVEKIATFN